MEKKLRDEDARVVDMLLDRGGSSGQANMPQVFTHHAPQEFTDRLQRVEQLLEVLNEMPALEPPADMVARTLDRIEESEAHGRSVPATANHVTHRPQA
ncbi:MAG TPA: hypothetical protein VG722_11870 [Tepidisphaeraceae bacterium]|nr:hypothetical protein [Tepidisphaeraceae bacterium]